MLNLPFGRREISDRSREKSVGQLGEDDQDNQGEVR
jgi:hypothetical protein